MSTDIEVYNHRIKTEGWILWSNVTTVGQLSSIGRGGENIILNVCL